VGLGDVSLACATALVDELVRGGVAHACLSPGSRSTPLALALARHPDITLHVHLDERASAFFALGLAKARRHPVAVACTSGTAAAELFPAVVEASQSRVPLAFLTADRPSHLRGSGANQTIDQVELYGRYARGYVEPPVPRTIEDIAAWREAGHRAVVEMSIAPIGPVHVNCPFDEPLVPEGEVVDEPARAEQPPFERREPAPTEDDLERFVNEVGGRRGVVVAGGSGWEPSWAVAELAGRLRWPLLAEPTSGLRRSMHLALTAGQALIGDEGWLSRNQPDVILQVGATPTSRTTQRFVAGSGRLLVLDHWHLDPDPTHTAALRLRSDPELLAREVIGRPFAGPGEPIEPAPTDWLPTWDAADARARRAIDRAMDGWVEPFEPRVARDLAAAIPDGGILLVGNSGPIRDVDLAMAPREGVRILANRGASGIDGLVATSLGVSAAERGLTYALVGDLSFLYDVGTLLWSARRGYQAVLVVLANGGGEIFSRLPQQVLPEHRELFVTPHDADIGAICSAAGAGHVRIGRGDDLIPAVDQAAGAGGVQVVEVAIDPELDPRRRDDLRAAVADALGDS
jgi:2-succinyl-5-enolpyruvyl-6-hydroxy-3-cyclohexene-1-carboxylate synthase